MSTQRERGREGESCKGPKGEGWSATKEWGIKHCVQYAVYILALVEGSKKRERERERERERRETPLFTLRIKVVTEELR